MKRNEWDAVDGFFAGTITGMCVALVVFAVVILARVIL